MLDERQSVIDAAVREACDVFRGVVDLDDCRDFVLAMILLKYLSDTGQICRGLGDKQPAGRHFVVPDEASFRTLHIARHQPGNGLRIDRALRVLEASNRRALQGVFQGISFDAVVLGGVEQRDRLLCRLLDVFAGVDVLDFHGDAEGAARVCDSLIQFAAASAGRWGGEFSTPPEISQLIARLVQPDAGDAIGDPCCGSGSLLIACNELVRQKSEGNGCALYGQEKNGNTWALARMNMILHGETQYQIEWGDTLRDPKLLVADGSLRKFEVVVSSPPFSLRDWGHEGAEADAHRRYWRGVPPRAAGDYAFLSHMVETMHPKVGRMAVVVSLGVLFRGAGEHQIRKQLIEENLIDTVINLPAKMLPHTSIPVAVLVLRRNKVDESVLFIDASHSYQRGKTQNVLCKEDLEQIELAYRERKDDGPYARLMTLEEIVANDYNLSVARYVRPPEEDGEIDLAALREERAKLKSELAILETRLATLQKGAELA